MNLIETKSKQRVTIANNKHINLYVKKDSTEEKREKIMNEWYISELKREIPKYIEKWESGQRYHKIHKLIILSEEKVEWNN